MKSTNSLTPASRAPGVSSLGTMISVKRTSVPYSSAEKNRGVYVAGRTWSNPDVPCPQANVQRANPGKALAAPAMDRIRRTSRRSRP
jgi:hypothetical protein